MTYLISAAASFCSMWILLWLFGEDYGAVALAEVTVFGLLVGGILLVSGIIGFPLWAACTLFSAVTYKLIAAWCRRNVDDQA